MGKNTHKKRPNETTASTGERERDYEKQLTVENANKKVQRNRWSRSNRWTR